jgi:hypothetical protein
VSRRCRSGTRSDESLSSAPESRLVLRATRPHCHTVLQISPDFAMRTASRPLGQLASSTSLIRRGIISANGPCGWRRHGSANPPYSIPAGLCSAGRRPRQGPPPAQGPRRYACRHVMVSSSPWACVLANAAMPAMAAAGRQSCSGRAPQALFFCAAELSHACCCW